MMLINFLILNFMLGQGTHQPSFLTCEVLNSSIPDLSNPRRTQIFTLAAALRNRRAHELHEARWSQIGAGSTATGCNMSTTEKRVLTA
eukprot:1158470-Pelagomonas_calceolata.AAC.3